MSGISRVECLFRVLSVKTKYDGERTAHIAPTYADRNGVPVEKHRAFFTATPSGDGEIKIHPEAPAAKLFIPGDYVGFYIYNGEPEEAAAEGVLRTDWQLDEVRISPTGLKPRLTVCHGCWNRDSRGHENGRNAVFFGTWSSDGFIEMQVDNTSAAPFFEIIPVPNGSPRRFVIDWFRG